MDSNRKIVNSTTKNSMPFQDKTVEALGFAGTRSGASTVAPRVAEVPAPNPDVVKVLFGGDNAVAPGYTSEGADAPLSVGADGKPRFEIDDSSFNVQGQDIPLGSPSQLLSGALSTTLGEVVSHNEMFSQYPHLRDVPVFFDSTMEETTKGGTMPPGGEDYPLGYIALNPNNSPEQNRLTLIHELQHAIQDHENHAPGADLYSAVAGDQLAREHLLKKREDVIEALTSASYSDFENTFDMFEDLKGLLPEDNVEAESGSRRIAFAKEDLQMVLGSPSATLEERTDVLFSSTLRLTSALYTVAKLVHEGRVDISSVDLGPYENAFSGLLIAASFPVGSDEEVDARRDADNGVRTAFLNGLPDAMYDIPTGNPGAADVRMGAYRSTIGEVEARNTADRLDLTGVERSNTAPETTEDIPRAFQWERERSGYAAGGLVSKNAMSDYFLASAGKMTEMEFVGKHKMSTLEFENQFAEDNNVDISGTEKLAEISTAPKGVKMDYSKKPRTMYQGGQVERDPVSGNEIPPGSAPVNVRDDIPAMLSEGEYIVPADVLKYFGVNFFEELRMKAKEGMMNMEQEGRTGGSPTSAPMQARPQEGPPRMAEGGVVETTTPTFDPTQWQTPGMSNPIMGSSAYTYVEYFGPGGASQMILHINGEPAQNIPTGYSETAPAPESPSQGRERRRRGARPTPPLAGSNQGQAGSGLFSSPLSELDFSDPDSIDTWATDKLATTNLNAGLGMAGVIGGAASSALELRHIAEVSAAARYYASINDQESADRLMGMADDARAELGMIGRWSESFSDGERIFENYRDSLGGGASGLGLPAGTSAEDRAGAQRKVAEYGQGAIDSSLDSYTKGGGDRGVYTSPTTGKTSGTMGGSKTATSSGPTTRPNNSGSRPSTVAKTGGTVGRPTSGFNKGGLVARPKK